MPAQWAECSCRRLQPGASDGSSLRPWRSRINIARQLSGSNPFRPIAIRAQMYRRHENNTAKSSQPFWSESVLAHPSLACINTSTSNMQFAVLPEVGDGLKELSSIIHIFSWIDALGDVRDENVCLYLKTWWRNALPRAARSCRKRRTISSRAHNWQTSRQLHCLLRLVKSQAQLARQHGTRTANITPEQRRDIEGDDTLNKHEKWNQLSFQNVNLSCRQSRRRAMQVVRRCWSH